MATARCTIRRLNPMRSDRPRSTRSGRAAEVADALELLRRLHVGRNSRPIAETITMLLEAVRAHAGIALWPTGEQALANCSAADRHGAAFRAQAHPRSAPSSSSIEEDAEHGEADEAPIVEEGTEGVRVMTVHKAKGLEFPVVILADPTCPATRDAAEPAHRRGPLAVAGAALWRDADRASGGKRLGDEA